MSIKTVNKIFIAALLLLSEINYSQTSPIRIACIGNSITEGNAMSTAQYDSYPAALGRFLGNGYDVRNFGKSGRTLLKKGDYPIWNEDVFKNALSFDPDIVIIALGTNDTKPQNWIYKNEFLKDYYSMIDTFKHGAANPDIYICYPLPSFSDAYDIRDSIIVADVIPMISQIVDSLNIQLLDFNTLFLDKQNLMPDGIHPLVEGSDLMAKFIYKKLTGISIDLLKENNVAANKNVFQLNDPVPQLVDLDNGTNLIFNSTSAPVIINLGVKYNIDMIQIFFTASPPNFSFSVFTSEDSAEWKSILDTAVATSPTTSVFTGKFNATDASYIKFQINKDGIAADSILIINEIKIFESRAVHAPTLYYNVISTSKSSSRIKVFFDQTSAVGEYLKIYRQPSEGADFLLIQNYRTTSSLNQTTVINFGSLNRYYSVAYFNGVEIQSDTITIISTDPTDIEINYNETLTEDYYLSQNYPNPFNPITNIGFSIPKTEYVTLKIYDSTGKEVSGLLSRNLNAGTYSVGWNASGFTSGIYFYQIIAGNFLNTKKLILLK